MSLLISRRAVLRTSLALGTSCLWPLARTAHACEFFLPHLRVTHPWSRATPQDAPFAIVCMRIDQVTKGDRLVGVETPVATKAEIGGISTGAAGMSLAIDRGRDMVLSEHGVHVRLKGLTQPLLLGRSYPMRLIFESGAMEAELSIDYTATQAI